MERQRGSRAGTRVLRLQALKLEEGPPAKEYHQPLDADNGPLRTSARKQGSVLWILNGHGSGFSPRASGSPGSPANTFILALGDFDRGTSQTHWTSDLRNCRYYVRVVIRC